MADNKYPYSAELKAPADNSKVDYDDPKTIAGMAKIGKMFGKMAKFYHAKNGIQMKIGVINHTITLTFHSISLNRKTV